LEKIVLNLIPTHSARKLCYQLTHSWEFFLNNEMKMKYQHLWPCSDAGTSWIWMCSIVSFRLACRSARRKPLQAINACMLYPMMVIFY